MHSSTSFSGLRSTLRAREDLAHAVVTPAALEVLAPDQASLDSLGVRWPLSCKLLPLILSVAVSMLRPLRLRWYFAGMNLVAAAASNDE